MMRQFLHIFLPLLLPLLLWFLWTVLRQGRPMPGWWRDAPWPWLIGIGLVLMAATLFAWALINGSGPGGFYVPPHTVEGGKVVPGRVVQ